MEYKFKEELIKNEDRVVVHLDTLEKFNIYMAWYEKGDIYAVEEWERYGDQFCHCPAKGYSPRSDYEGMTILSFEDALDKDSRDKWFLKELYRVNVEVEGFDLSEKEGISCGLEVEGLNCGNCPLEPECTELHGNVLQVLLQKYTEVFGEKVERSDFRVGDTVYCDIFGKGKVVSILIGTDYPVNVKYPTDATIRTYTKSGEYFSEEEGRTLFFTPSVKGETTKTEFVKPEPKKPETVELTLSEIADKIGVDVETLRIKE